MKTLISVILLSTLVTSIDVKPSKSGPISPKAIPDCSPNTFTIDINEVRVEGVSVNVRYRLQLNVSYDLTAFSLADYFIQCLDYMVVRANERQVTYKPRDSDNLLNYFDILVDNLDPLTLYSIQAGYQLKNRPNLPVLASSPSVRTCFGEPERPVNLTLSSYLNGSYLITWNDPPQARPQPCSYRVVLKYSGSNNEREMDTGANKWYYLSKENSRTKVNVRVYSVNEVACLPSSYQNECTNKTIRSRSATAIDVEPGRDFINRAIVGCENSMLVILIGVFATIWARYF